MTPSRRAVLAAGATALAVPAKAADPSALARDEAHWARVAALYDIPPPGVIQLENGQFGAMTRAVRAIYEQKLAKVNRETSLYTRRAALGEVQAVRAKAAAFLGVGVDEIAFTRGGTESMLVLITGYNRLKPGDALLYADLDYDSMQVGMDSLARLRGVRVVKFDLPEPATKQALIDAYDRALKANPDVRMMLLTHLSHRTGLIPPIKEITALAKSRGVDVLLYCGHALGQTEFSLREMGVEFAGLNLHKWIGSPLGVGLVYIRKDRIPDIEVSILEGPSDRIEARAHLGTVSYASVLTVSDALDAHAAVGPAAKARRLLFLRDRWAETLRDHPRVQVLTPPDPTLHAGMTSFRIAGQTTLAQAQALKTLLLDRHRIFTIERGGVAKGACIRVSPSFVNSADQMDALVAALKVIAA